MPPIIRVPLKYGLIAGILGTVLVLLFYYLVQHPFLIPVFLDFRIFIFGIFIFFTLKEIRDFHYGGILYFWQGLLSSLMFTFVFGLLSSACIAFFIAIEPHFLESYITLSIEQLRALPPDIVERIGKEVYERNLELLPATNGLDLAFLYFTQSFLISFFISIILSVILRSQPKT